MNEIAGLEFGVAEDLVFGFADQEAGQLQDVVVNGGADACGQELGLLLLFGGQDHGGHNYLLGGGVSLAARPSPSCVQKFYQHFSCSHPACR
jgi:hypothetical protein